MKLLALSVDSEVVMMMIFSVVELTIDNVLGWTVVTTVPGSPQCCHDHSMSMILNMGHRTLVLTVPRI